MRTEELFRSADLLARFVGTGEAATCIVTFDSLGVISSLDRPGFGEAYLRERGIDAVHVISRENLWYQEPELPRALARIRERTGSYLRVLAYGSSMGGYGAIRFGGEAGAQAALALSPQFSIDPRRVPFERRWASHGQRIWFRHETALRPLDDVFLAYDPHDPDRIHADLFAAEIPITRIRLPYAGHPVGAYLSETGLLTELFDAAVAGHLDPAFEARARAGRKRAAHYHFTLARLASPRRTALKVALARRAIATNPHDPVYHGYLAVLLDVMGDIDGAAASHRAATADAARTSPILLASYGRFLLRQGRPTESFATTRPAAAVAAREPAIQRVAGLAALMSGEWRAAAGMLGAFVRPVPRRALGIMVAVATFLAPRAAGSGRLGARLRAWAENRHAREIQRELRDLDLVRS